MIEAREAGILLHITSLPGAYGIGDLGAGARALLDKLSAMQFGVWQILPTGPTGYGDSPYHALSTFAGNELLIDVADLVELGLLNESETDELRSLPESFVDYGRLVPLKDGILKLAASRFDDVTDRTIDAEYQEFLDRHSALWLHDYALYRALKSKYRQQPWPEWSEQHARHDEQAICDFEAEAADDIEAVKVLQFLFYRQWKSLRHYAQKRGVKLFGDMPIYIALDSADAWANRELLRIDDAGRPDRVAGVPPDYFSADGQLWGNPLYDWAEHAATGYRWWIRRLRAAMEQADLIRIDHFRGFESYWSVPGDADTARDGRWEPGPGSKIFVALKEALGDLPVVAEDLGVITPEVESLRDDNRLPGMCVLQFAVHESDFRLADVPENCVCYTGTHDNDTTVGWFHGAADDLRNEHDIAYTQDVARRLCGGRDETIHIDFIRAAFSTRARLAIAPLQDFLGLGSEARFNRPGIAGGNWRWRVLDEQLTDEFCSNATALIAAAGRGRSSNEYYKQ